MLIAGVAPPLDAIGAVPLTDVTPPPPPPGTFTSTTPGDVSDAVTPAPVKFNVVVLVLTLVPSSLVISGVPPPPPTALSGSSAVPLPMIVTPSTATSVKQGVQAGRSGSGMSPVWQMS